MKMKKFAKKEKESVCSLSFLCIFYLFYLSKGKAVLNNIQSEVLNMISKVNCVCKCIAKVVRCKVIYVLARMQINKNHL